MREGEGRMKGGEDEARSERGRGGEREAVKVSEGEGRVQED